MYFAPTHFFTIDFHLQNEKLWNSAEETFFVALDTSDLLPGYHLSLGQEDEK